MEIKGVIAPALTFFKENQSIDSSLCEKHLEWMLSQGVHGIFTTGTYGMGFLMSREERVSLYKLSKEVATHHKGSFVIAHVGTPDTDTSVFLTKEANRLGLQGVSAITPFNLKYKEAEIIAYYKAICDNSEIPVYAYNNPDMTNVTISPTLLKKLLAIGVKGLKDSSVSLPLLESILEHKETPCQYISGTTSNWIAVKKMGVNTMIAGMCNYLPNMVRKLYDLSFDSPENGEIYYSIIADLSRKIKFTGSIELSYLVLAALGFERTFVRSPLTIDYIEDRLQQIRGSIEEANNKIAQIV